ncbi:hypothetical protein B0A69_03425 [Chryseobacterium shigense]|uniref:Ricin-type beta-trefoil lectin domain-like n=1 Tax=Chryseobacterium shigense TaxID=297244 RepID=A0A1N7I7D7_9FLAO|nr:RICIN domain-containing protein [Chryseobacterium shigense]PQA97107.1 hypothetical protein B0A69_03425 [Chryseobacterium shigense]SIS32979.1 Ricin-type beta-trefoil lectin domain-like [Chryseobacterium shigense]
MMTKNNNVRLLIMKLCLSITFLLSNTTNINAQINTQKNSQVRENYSPGNTNGAQAAAVDWIRNIAFLELSNLLQQFARINMNYYQLNWRPQVNDTRQRLIRWDRRPPNQIFGEGFVPFVNTQPRAIEANLPHYVSTNSPSIFVSTTQTFDEGRRWWVPYDMRYVAVYYAYEIYAPGGIDVNASLGEHEYDDQNEIAFPGGIQSQYIRSAIEYRSTNIYRVWINPRFRGPENLPPVGRYSSAGQIQWYDNHPEGNNKGFFNDKKYDMSTDRRGEITDIPKADETKRVLEDGVFQIKSSVNSDVAVDLGVAGNVVGWQNNSATNQIWEFTYNASKKAYKIRNLNSKNLILTWDSTKGKNVIGFQDEDNSDQFWQIEVSNNGEYILKNNKNHDMVLDLLDSKTTNGTKIQVHEVNGQAAQKWIITPWTGQIINDGEYQIRSSIPNSNVVVDLGVANNVVGWQNKSSHNQVWEFTYNASQKAYKIKNLLYNSFVLTCENGSNVIGFPDINYDGQFWRIEKRNNGEYVLRNNKNPEMVLDLSGSQTTNGTKIQVYNSNNGVNQKWTITPWIGKTIDDGVYQIKSSINSNVVVDLGPAHNVIGWQNKYSTNQMWEFTYNSSKKAYKIRNLSSDNLVLAWASRKDRSVIGYNDNGENDQFWQIEMTNDGMYILRNIQNHEMLLDLLDSKTTDGTRIQVHEANDQAAQKWSLHPLHRPQVDQGNYYIGSKLSYKNVIDHNQPRHNLELLYNRGLISSQWRIEFDPSEKAYKIKTARYQNSGWVFLQKGYNINVDNVDTPEINQKHLWFIEYDIKAGGFIIRSKADPTQVVTLKGDRDINSQEVKFDSDQIWYMIPIMD